MARSIIYMVSDDSETIQKAKQFANLNNIDVKIYSCFEWQQGLNKPDFVKNLMSDSPTLTSGQVVNNILPFPGKNIISHDKKVSTINELEAVAIENAIKEYGGNLTEAAKALGIGRATLYRKVKQYHIDPSDARKQRKVA